MPALSTKHKIDNLILNYFIQEGYQEAAISFAKETGIDLMDSRSAPESAPGHGGGSGDATGASGSHRPSSGSGALVNELATIGTISDTKFSDLISSYFDGDSHAGRPVGASGRTDGGAGGTFQLDSSAYARPYRSAATASSISHGASPGYSTIVQRKQIKLLILKGSITEAIAKISEYFPTILDTNNLLYFKLLRLNLIEMIRSHKLDPDITSEKEKKFLSDILTFVRENLINKVIHSAKLLKELEITMSLLCFNFDPTVKNIEQQKDLPEELRNLFNLSLRSKCYGLVNKAILNLTAAGVNGVGLGGKPFGYAGASGTGGGHGGGGGVAAGDPVGRERNVNLLEFDLSNLPAASSSLADDDELDLEEFDEDFELLAPARGTRRASRTASSAHEVGFGLGARSGSTAGSGSKSRTKKSQDDEDELTKLQDLSLESKLEKIIKLWTLTEQRFLDLNIIKEKRYILNDE